MITKTNFSYGELYQLFGSDCEFEVERVFDSLLCGISILKLHQNNYSYGGGCLDGGQDGGIQVFAVPDLSTIKTELPKYLNKQYDRKEMSLIDSKMLEIKTQKELLAAIPWYKVGERISRWLEIKTLESEDVPIQSVFGYLEHRITGMTKDELYAAFRKFAELYVSAKFLW